MELFCTEAERNACRAKEKRFSLIFRILLCAGIAAFILLCLMIRTENAKAMHIVLIAVTAVLGWACILVWILGVRETRTQLGHLDMLLGGEAGTAEGRMTLEDGTIQIPKSIRIRKVVLDTGAEEPLRLNIDEPWALRLPPDGSRVRLRVVHSYIGGAETLERAAGPERKESRMPALLRKAGKLLPLLGIWALAAVFLSSFVFYQIRDTDPAHKITVYMDGSVADGDALAARIEKALDGAVRLAEVRPFSYFMFGSGQLKTGDLYILPDSALEQFGEWILADGESWIVYDPESRTCVAGETFRYADSGTQETWRMYIGAESPHLQDGLARRTAEILTATEKEETK